MTKGRGGQRHSYHGDDQGIRESVKDTPAVLSMHGPFQQQVQAVLSILTAVGENVGPWKSKHSRKFSSKLYSLRRERHIDGKIQLQADLFLCVQCKWSAGVTGYTYFQSKWASLCGVCSKQIIIITLKKILINFGDQVGFRLDATLTVTIKTGKKKTPYTLPPPPSRTADNSSFCSLD